jgi:hypothetical protein
MRALLHQSATLQHKNYIGQLGSAKPVGYEDGGQAV